MRRRSTRSDTQGSRKFLRVCFSPILVVAVLVAIPPTAASATSPSDERYGSLAVMESMATWLWTARLSWRDNPAMRHPFWAVGASLGLHSDRIDYDGLRLDTGASTYRAATAPTRPLGWVALAGPVAPHLSAAVGWYRSESARVGFPNEALAQRFVFSCAEKVRDDVVWTLAWTPRFGITIGMSLGLERTQASQHQILWAGESRLRPQADTTFDLPIAITTSGMRPLMGAGIAWSWLWLSLSGAVQVLFPHTLDGKYRVTPRPETLTVTIHDELGAAHIEEKTMLRAAVSVRAEPPYSLIELGATIRGPDHPGKLIGLQGLAVTGPAGPGALEELPTVWSDKKWDWHVHVTLGARLDRWGLRLVSGFSATGPRRNLCGRISTSPDFRAGLALLAKLGNATIAAGYAYQWSNTRCDHPYLTAFNPTAGPNRGATDHGRSFESHVASVALVVPIPK